MNKTFSDNAWEDYLSWQKEDKRTLNKINELLKDIDRNGNVGIGHPKPLTGDLSGYWSREIDKKNRLVYRLMDNDIIYILQCKSHYGDK
jgi:toxin YoeB